MTGVELAECRQELNLTQEQLAEHLAIDVSVLKEWEAAAVACADYPMLLEHAMDSVDYDVNGMTDEEFEAIKRRVDEACARTDAMLARHAEEKIAALAEINVTVRREDDAVVAECNEDVAIALGKDEDEAIEHLRRALKLRYDLAEKPKVKRVICLGGLNWPGEFTRHRAGQFYLTAEELIALALVRFPKDLADVDRADIERWLKGLITKARQRVEESRESLWRKNLVRLDPDVAEYFKTSEEANEVLRQAMRKGRQ
jgi:transcriptional regulator with XRE-family HTH domain